MVGGAHEPPAIFVWLMRGSLLSTASIGSHAVMRMNELGELSWTSVDGVCDLGAFG